MERYRISRSAQAIILLVALLFTSACGSAKRLRPYDFRNEPAAAIYAAPPRPIVFTSGGDAWIDLDRPIQSALRMGTAVAKQAERHRAQQRLDSAFQRVDVGEIMALTVLTTSRNYLGYRPVGDPADAAFVFDVRVKEYGILANSWENATYFVLKGDLVLLDNRTGKQIWKKGIREREMITDSIFGLGVAVGNVMTARMLAALSVDEMAAGLERLSEHAATRLSHRLQADYAKSRARG
jgi:hypothetical protein